MRSPSKTALAVAVLAAIPLAVPTLGWADQTTPEPAPPAALTSEAQQALSSGQPVTIQSETTATTLVQAMPDGTRQAVVSPAPFLTHKDGTWQPLDLDLARNSQGRLAPADLPTAATLDAGGGTTLARVTDAQQRWFELRWPTALPTPTVEDNTALYPEVVPGVDLVAVTGQSAVSTYFVVKTAAAGRNPALADLSYTWSASPGLRLEADATSVRVLDDDNTTVFQSPGVAMWDSSQTAPDQRDTSIEAALAGSDSTRRQLTAQVSGQRLSLGVDESLLQDPDTVYPVIIDPSPAASSYANWTMVWSNGQSFWGSTTEHARVGYDGWSDNKISRAYYTFDVSKFVGTRINSAVFTARNIHSPNWTCNLTSYGANVNVYTTGPISSATTWANQPSAKTLQASSGYAHGHSASCPGYFDTPFNVVTGVRESLSAGKMTLMMRSANESDRDGWRQYDNIAGSMPKLVVTYDVIPDVPARAYVVGEFTPQFTSAAKPPLWAQVHSDDPAAIIRAEFSTAPYGTTTWSTPIAGNNITGDGKSTTTSWAPSEGRFAYRARACTVNTATGKSDLCSGWSGAYGIYIDRTRPATPVITAKTTPILANTTATFNITSTSTDTLQYLWGDTDTPTTVATDTATGADVTLKPRFGPSRLYAIAQDKAGNRSTTGYLDIKATTNATVIHRYPLDSNGTDTSGSNIPLNLALNGTGTNLWVPGTGGGAPGSQCTRIQGQAFRTGGQNVRLLNTSGTNLDSTTAFTVTAWIKPEAADLAPGEHFAVWYTGTGGRAFMISIKDGNWSGSIGTPGSPNITGPQAEPDRWTFVALSYSPGANGAPGKAVLHVSGDGTERSATNVTPVQGANLGIGWGGTPWTGTIDLVTIYPTALADRTQVDQAATSGC